MENVLIQVNGYLGDILFASSIANAFSNDAHTTFELPKVYYNINHYQSYELLMLNPDIKNVSVRNHRCGKWPDSFDKVFVVGPIDQSRPATIQYQEQCGIFNPTLGYRVFTNSYYDDIAKMMLNPLRHDGRKIVAVQENWNERTFGFTREEYAKGINQGNEGYGGRRRNTDYIRQKLSEEVILVPVGFPDGTHVGDIGLHTTSIYSMTASIIKECDWMVGAEGGLTNLAAGVGTKTIITGDFIHQLYAWNGVIKKIEKPQMGPRTYFPEDGHVELDPYISDDEVVEQMLSIINGN